MKIINIIILFFLFSFIGWLIEVFEGIINRREFVNRGFLIGPYCPIYGFGALLMLYFLKRYENDYVAIFVFGSLICTILEFFTSLLLEKIFNTRWWDYRDKKINLNGRVCLESMVLFGIGALFLIKIINPLVSKCLLLPPKIKILLVITFIIGLIIDLVFSLSVIVDMKKNNIIKNIDITKVVNKRIKEVLLDKNYLRKRLLNAFPLLRLKSRR